MKLNVPLISQAKNSVDCGVACVAMLLKYYKVPFSYQKLKKDLGVFKEGTYAPQLGLYLLNNGFKATIVTQHPRIFTIHSKFKNAAELLTHLETVKKVLKSKGDKQAIKFFIDFVKAGGKIIVQVPNAKIMKQELGKKRPMIALLTHWFLFKSKFTPRFTLHFNVITGLDNKYVYVNDPDWGKPFGGKHKHKIEDYLYAIHASTQSYADNSSLLLINKK